MIRMRRRGKRAAALLVDRVLAVMAPLITTRRRPAGLPASPRVLVIRCDHIGDAIMATPVLQPLRAALGASHLDLLVGPWAAPLFEHHPAVNGVITYATPWWLAARGASRASQATAWAQLPGMMRRIRAARYDIAIDLRGDLRQILFFVARAGATVRASSDRTGGARLLTHVWPYDASLHEVEKNMAVASLLGDVPRSPLDLPVPALDAELERTLRQASGPRGFAALALRGTEPNRAWPAEYAARCVSVLRERLGLGAVVVGAAGDPGVAGALNLAGRTTLPQALSVFQHATVAVTVDSGPMHLAAAAGCPVVALFGPGDPRECRPWTDRAIHLPTGDGAPCGCIHPTCDFGAGPGRCMTRISVDAIADAVARLLSRRPE